jgi:hypothetical protein
MLLDKKSETNLHHLAYFLLFTSQNEFLIQIWLMSSKHIAISLFEANQFSSPSLTQIALERPIKH